MCSLPDCQCAGSWFCINKQPHSTFKQMVEEVSVAHILSHLIQDHWQLLPQILLSYHAVQHLDESRAVQGM